MSEPVLALLSPNEDDQRLADALAESLGWRLNRISDPTQLGELMHASPQGAGLVSLESIAQIQIPFFPEASLSNRLHLTLAKEDSGKARRILESGAFGSFLLRAPGRAADCAKVYGPLLQKATSAPALDALAFPADSVQTLRVQSSMQKNFSAFAVSSELKSMKVNPRIADLVAMAVDELLMNAFFDAPADEQGAQTLKQVPRSQDISGEGIEFQLGVTDTLIGCTIIDRQGQMDRGRVLSCVLKEQGMNGESPIEQDGEGAGLGLAMVFNSGGSLVFRTRQGTCTEVTALFSNTESVAQFRKFPKFASTIVI